MELGRRSNPHLRGLRTLRLGSVLTLCVISWSSVVGAANVPALAYLRSSNGGHKFKPLQLDDVGEDVNFPHVKVFNRTVHVLFDNDTAPHKILYRRSTNGGRRFAPSVRLDVIDGAGAPNNGDSTEPDLAVSGTTVHAIWEDDPLDANGNPESCCNKPNRDDIFYTRSLDDGVTFSIPVNMTNSPQVHNRDPVVAAEGSLVGIAYEGRDIATGNDDVRFLRSIDGGTTWGSEVNLTNAVGTQDEPAIDVDGSAVHVVYRDRAMLRVGYVRSSDAGATFSSPVDLPGPGNMDETPSVLAQGNLVHVVACRRDDPADPNDGHDVLYYRSTDGGETFAPPVLVSRSTEQCNQPVIDGSGNHLHVIFKNDLFGKADIFYVQSDDGGLSFTPPRNLSDDPDNSEHPSLAVAVEPEEEEEHVFVVWKDKTSFLFTLKEDQSLPLREGGTREFGDEDIIRFTGAAYEMVLDGGDVGLHGLDIDAFAILPPVPPAILPSFLLSLRHSGTVPGVGPVDDSDVLLFTPTSLGETTAGTFSLYLDSSDIGLATSDEDIDSVETDGSTLYLSTKGPFRLADGLTGSDEDVFTCNGFTSGPESACASTGLPFDGAAAGINDMDVGSVTFDAKGKTVFFAFPTHIASCALPKSPPAPPLSLAVCGVTVPLNDVFHAAQHGIHDDLVAVDLGF